MSPHGGRGTRQPPQGPPWVLCLGSGRSGGGSLKCPNSEGFGGGRVQTRMVFGGNPQPPNSGVLEAPCPVPEDFGDPCPGSERFWGSMSSLRGIWGSVPSLRLLRSHAQILGFQGSQPLMVLGCPPPPCSLSCQGCQGVWGPPGDGVWSVGISGVPDSFGVPRCYLCCQGCWGAGGPPTAR